ncbi:MAG: SDR family oxidoreductase [Acidobacteriota bacterium]|nr:SDR family oxidoreductase [Acidobacteriota bacterium]
MRVFVTGASGHIASAVIPELIENGHQVRGLARSDAAAAVVAALGADVVRGELDDLDVLTAASAEADGVIHLAFKHEAFATGDFQGAVASDLAAVRAMGETLKGTGKAFVTTGGTLMLASTGRSGRSGTEDDRIEGGPRVDTENYSLSLARVGVRSSVVRLAPLIHSDLDHHGFTAALIGFARDSGVAAYIGDGENRWPAANTHDIGTLYRRAMERAAPGTVCHGADDLGIPFRVIAETIGDVLNVRATSVTPEEAPRYLGFLAGFAHLDNPVSNDSTRQSLGWEPTHPRWVEDVRSGHYLS